MITTRKARPRKTVEDFMNLPADTRAELIDGELFMSPSPRSRHQNAVVNLVRCICDFVRAQSLGRVFVAPFDVHLPSGDVVEPDVLFIRSANLGILKDWIYGVPNLVVEVLSPDGIERDRIVKRDLYARNGVPEYWIVDPDARTVEVYSLRGDRYEPDGYFESADVLVSPSLPGFRVAVSQLFD